ncbi:hypothetical protein TUM18999_02350 [Pseudomonas tohonis]|jgi:hypothetical protein|uniref:Uncharacterized protein n=1 Tax=Pseudomonas tohonis TaxID=2725477 RepID=A0A6J4DZ72_9PSED|nr:hypothetical protein TUM18999_02350 [Pseudomonas tohonis]
MMDAQSALRAKLALSARIERDRLRTAMQAPISAPRYRVLYLKDGKEKHSAWFYKHDYARVALQLMQKKYGDKKAIIYID